MKALTVPDDETIRYLNPEESARLRAALVARDERAAVDRANANLWRQQRDYELMPEIDGYCNHMTPMVSLTLNTGVRRGELFSLTWESIDLRNKVMTVIARHSKGKKTRSIPLNKQAMSVL
jgi:integrase